MIPAVFFVKMQCFALKQSPVAHQPAAVESLSPESIKPTPNCAHRLFQSTAPAVAQHDIYNLKLCLSSPASTTAPEEQKLREYSNVVLFE